MTGLEQLLKGNVQLDKADNEEPAGQHMQPFVIVSVWPDNRIVWTSRVSLAEGLVIIAGIRYLADNPELNDRLITDMKDVFFKQEVTKQ